MLHKLPLDKLQEEVSRRYEEYGLTRPRLNDFASRLHLDVSSVYMKALEKGKADGSVDFVETATGLAPDGVGTRLADVLLFTLWIADTFGIDLLSFVEMKLSHRKAIYTMKKRIAKERAEAEALMKVKTHAEASEETEPKIPESASPS